MSPNPQAPTPPQRGRLPSSSPPISYPSKKNYSPYTGKVVGREIPVEEAKEAASAH